jgi:hypothetical protein
MVMVWPRMKMESITGLYRKSIITMAVIGCFFLYPAFLIGSFLAIGLVQFPVMWLIGDIKPFNPLFELNKFIIGHIRSRIRAFHPSRGSPTGDIWSDIPQLPVNVWWRYFRWKDPTGWILRNFRLHMRAHKGTPFGTSKWTPFVVTSGSHGTLVVVQNVPVAYAHTSDSGEGLFRSREFRYFLRAWSACIIIHSCHLIEFTVAGACLKDYTRFNMTFQYSIFNISMYVENFFLSHPKYENGLLKDSMRSRPIADSAYNKLLNFWSKINFY